jgi:transcription initiation factor TFIIE subunit alpha
MAIIMPFRLNEQLKPIVDLLRETENITLAPEVLEPTPQSIRKV